MIGLPPHDCLPHLCLSADAATARAAPPSGPSPRPAFSHRLHSWPRLLCKRADACGIKPPPGGSGKGSGLRQPGGRPRSSWRRRWRRPHLRPPAPRRHTVCRLHTLALPVAQKATAAQTEQVAFELAQVAQPAPSLPPGPLGIAAPRSSLRPAAPPAPTRQPAPGQQLGAFLEPFQRSPRALDSRTVEAEAGQAVGSPHTPGAASGRPAAAANVHTGGGSERPAHHGGARHRLRHPGAAAGHCGRPAAGGRRA